MASLTAPNPRKFALPSPLFSSPSSSSSSSSSSYSCSLPLRRRSLSRSFSSRSRVPESAICRCQSSSSSSSSPSPFDPSSSSSSSRRSWESIVADVLRTTFERLECFLKLRIMTPFGDGSDITGADSEAVAEDEPDWDWDRWTRHFEEVEEAQKLVSVLKSQLYDVVRCEEFEDAARLKVAIAAAASKDVVGCVTQKLKRALEEERYLDAAFLRDNAGAGLVGWWYGITEDSGDTSGLIIRITAEHGRYVARTYNPGIFSTVRAGVPLFEIFFTVNKKGEYKQQAVYLKRKGEFVSSKASGLDPSDSTEPDILITIIEDNGDEHSDKDNVDITEEELPAFQKAFKDMNPGAKVKVLKVTAPGKVDEDLISKVIKQIIEEDDEEKDDDTGNLGAEDGVQDKSYQDFDMVELDSTSGFAESKERSEIARDVVVRDLMKKVARGKHKFVIRVPAKLEKDGRSSFSFSIEKDVNEQDSNDKKHVHKKSKVSSRRSFEEIILNLTRFIGGEKVPLTALRDVNELINLTLNGIPRNPLLSGTTTFHRIELPAFSDPLNGFYTGAHGINGSEVIHLQRKFGQWEDDSGTTENSNLEFYEYVEALKITGDSYVPAGQIAFRAKVGQRNQLPHKGIIPEELGVLARYKGQGRLAGPKYQKPRWVDGELILLDGKFVNGGPVVGFVYWAPDFNLILCFNRLKFEE